MTVTKPRALLAAILLASSALAITAAHAQDREVNDQASGNRFERKAPAKAPAAGAAVLSSAVSKALTATQTNLAANKIPEALAAAKEALAASKTDYEKMKSNQFLTNILVKQGDNAGAAAAAIAAADTPPEAVPLEDRNMVYSNGAILALNTNHPDKALVYARQLLSINPNDARALDIEGKALFSSKDPSAPAFFQKQVDSAIAAGKAPSHDALQMLMVSQINLKDEVGAEKTMVLQVQYFNDPADWKQIIDVAITTRGVRDIDAVMLGRLLYASGGTVTKDDAQLIGETTQKLALYGDAVASQAKGATLQLDQARVAADKASLPQQIGMGAGQNGLFNVKLAEALYGYGMYPEAEAAAKVAQTKGGADASEVLMTLGMSQAMQGKYPEAIATFGAVTGGSPATPRAAELWIVYSKIKGGLVPGQTAAK